MKKAKFQPLLDPLSPDFWGVLVPLAPHKIWDVMLPYLKHFLSRSQKIGNFDHFRLNGPVTKLKRINSILT